MSIDHPIYESKDEKGIVGKTVDVGKVAAVKAKDGTVSVLSAMKDNPGHAVAGAVIGQLLIPIPIVGFAIGGVIGGWIGKKNRE